MMRRVLTTRRLRTSTFSRELPANPIFVATGPFHRAVGQAGLQGADIDCRALLQMPLNQGCDRRRMGLYEVMRTASHDLQAGMGHEACQALTHCNRAHLILVTP